jgi:hypothetical protein
VEYGKFEKSARILQISRFWHWICVSALATKEAALLKACRDNHKWNSANQKKGVRFPKISGFWNFFQISKVHFKYLYRPCKVFQLFLFFRLLLFYVTARKLAALCMAS